MSILHSLFFELKAEFAGSEKGKERSIWFLHTLLAIGLLKVIKGRWACPVPTSTQIDGKYLRGHTHKDGRMKLFRKFQFDIIMK